VDLTTTISEIRGLSVADRWALIDAILASIEDDDATPPISEAVASELDRRLADHRADPTDVVSWEDARASIEARLAG
jgi:putative addiction module component (TIGR02574 family)